MYAEVLMNCENKDRMSLYQLKNIALKKQANKELLVDIR